MVQGARVGDSSDELQQEIDSLRADVAFLQSELAAGCALLPSPCL